MKPKPFFSKSIFLKVSLLNYIVVLGVERIFQLLVKTVQTKLLSEYILNNINRYIDAIGLQ